MLSCYVHTLGTRKRHEMHTCGINSASPHSENHQAEMSEFPCVAPAVQPKVDWTQVITPVISLHASIYTHPSSAASLPRWMICTAKCVLRHSCSTDLVNVKFS